MNEEKDVASTKSTKSKSSKGTMMPTVVLAVVVIIIGLFLVSRYTKFNVLGLSNSTGYQAVFLGNGQVYFGHVSNDNARTVTLEDIYYLQVNSNLQTPPGNEVDANQGELSLVKLGNELHGPMDKMRINQSAVLFIEDLKDDSKVVDAINRYSEDQ